VNISKIAGLVGAAVAVVAAFVMIPYAGLALAVLGMIVGWAIAAEDNVRVIVSAMALATFSGTFGSVPTVGPWITAILANIAAMVAGAALLIILRNVYGRIKP
jgi:hypothetical protein